MTRFEALGLEGGDGVRLNERGKRILRHLISERDIDGPMAYAGIARHHDLELGQVAVFIAVPRTNKLYTIGNLGIDIRPQEENHSVYGDNRD